eukprot:14005590-Ditylum_brightwellii.AAC.1
MWRNFVHTEELEANLSLLMGPTSLQGCVERILDWSQVQSQARVRPDGPKTQTDIRTKTDISEPISWPTIRTSEAQYSRKYAVEKNPI